MKKYEKQFINNEWTEGSGSTVSENRNPYTNELLYTFRSAGTADIDKAYAAAYETQKKWQSMPIAEKVFCMEKLYALSYLYAPIIDECLISEAGSAFPKREYEKNEISQLTRFYMTYPYLLDGRIQESCDPDIENFIFRKPKGIITVIAPWNVPFILAMRSVLPAVATGNAVVLKPASETPASAMIIAEMFQEAGFPEGLLNVISGSGSEIGDYLIQHPLSSMLSFTGSTEVGQRIGSKAGEKIKDISLELGGNNSMLILEDADLTESVSAALFGAYFNQGQVCMGLNRIIAVKERYEEFISLFSEKVKEIKAGNPADPENFIGPLINQTQVKHCNNLIRSAVDDGVRVCVEGKTEGNVIWPWLLADVKNDMPIAQEEVFGPVVSIIRAEDTDDAVRLANDTKYGLSNSVFGKDVYRAMQVAKRLESGMVHVNNPSIGDEPHVMFGGEKQSGIGRFNGKWVLEKFTTEQWISVK